MKYLVTCAVSAAVLLLATACAPSRTTASAKCDAQCPSDIEQAMGGSLGPVGTDASGYPVYSDAAAAPPRRAKPITGNYDSASCADWAATDADSRRLAAFQHAVEFGDPTPEADAADLANIITQACEAYGAQERPRHIAKISIATVYGAN